MPDNEEALMRETFLRAVRIKDVDAIRALLQRGADANDQSAWPTPLSVAVDISTPEKRLHIATILLEHGADPNVRITTPAFRPPLTAATIRHDRALVALLLSYGADPNIQGRGHMTPLMYAVTDPLIAKELLDRGASVHVQDAAGNTPIMHAALLIGPIVPMMLEHAGDTATHLRDDRGRTAMIWTLSTNANNLASLLPHASFLEVAEAVTHVEELIDRPRHIHWGVQLLHADGIGLKRDMVWAALRQMLPAASTPEVEAALNRVEELRRMEDEDELLYDVQERHPVVDVLQARLTKLRAGAVLKRFFWKRVQMRLQMELSEDLYKPGGRAAELAAARWNSEAARNTYDAYMEKLEPM